MEIRNLKDSTSFSPEGVSKKIVFNTKEVLCFILSLMPGQTISVHKHENAVLIATVLSGECEVTVNQDKFELKQGNALMVEGRDDFGIPKVSSDLALHVTLSPNPADPQYAKEFG